MSDARNSPSKASVDDSMWEDDLDKGNKPSYKKSGWAMLACRCTMWACTKITKLIPSFRWDGKCIWWIEGALAEKICQ